MLRRAGPSQRWTCRSPSLRWHAIDTRELASRALPPRQERWRAAWELLSVFSYSFKATRSGSLAVEWLSPGFSALTGLPTRRCRTCVDLLSLVEDEDRASAEAHIAVLLGGTPDERDLHIRARSGEERWLRFRAVPIRERGGGVVRIVGTAEEITESVMEFKLLERRATERTRELTALLDISCNVASTLELEPLLGLILTELQKLVDYTGAAILMPEGEDLVLLDYLGPMPRDQAMGLRIPIHQSPHYEAVIETRSPVIIPDLLGETAVAYDFRRSVQRFKPFFGYAHSLLCAPLLMKDRLIGILRLDHRDRDHFTERHAELVMAIASQLAVAIENARLYEGAQRLATLEERQRIARELHDSVSQALYGINLGAETAIRLSRNGSPELGESLEYVRGLAEAGLLEMRTLLFELRPDAMASEGLAEGLRKMLKSLGARHKIRIEAELCPEPEADLDTKEAAYRIAQEAANNTVKHARATTISLCLGFDGNTLRLDLRDDGAGFEIGEAHPGHMGLRTMAERAERLGGSLDVISAPGEGTRVSARLPAKCPHVRKT
jgi:signal transduction histidine kinase